MLVLEQASNAVLSIDRKYRNADFNGKISLKDERDKLYNEYAKARLKLLEDGMICTDDNVKEMMEIRAEIEQAIQTQSIVIGIGKLVKFLAKFAK